MCVCEKRKKKKKKKKKKKLGKYVYINVIEKCAFQ